MLIRIIIKKIVSLFSLFYFTPMLTLSNFNILIKTIQALSFLKNEKQDIKKKRQFIAIKNFNFIN